MQDSLLLELIVSLEVAERRRAARFLRSAYGNSREEATCLYDALLETLRRSRQPDSEEMFAVVFPGVSYDAPTFRLLCSHLHKCLQRFLVLDAFEKEDTLYAPLQVKVFRKKGLHRHVARALKKQQEYAFWNAETEMARYRMEEERFSLSARRGRTKQMRLQQNEDALDDTLVAFKLRQACFTRSHEAVFRTVYEVRFLDPVLEYARYSDKPAIQVYYACYVALYYEPTEQNFVTYRKLLLQHGKGFPVEELRSLYISALNYCIRRINENADSFLKEAFDLYDSGIRNGLILENEKISRFTFNNYVGIGIRLGYVQRIQDFVKDYAAMLDEAWRRSTVALNMARIYYQMGAFDKALTSLQQSDYQDLITNMTVKILQAKIYYDLREFDVLESHLSTMKRFIRRNKKMAYHHKNWSNIHEFFFRLLRVNPHNQKEINALRKGSGVQKY